MKIPESSVLVKGNLQWNATLWYDVSPPCFSLFWEVRSVCRQKVCKKKVQNTESQQNTVSLGKKNWPEITDWIKDNFCFSKNIKRRLNKVGKYQTLEKQPVSRSILSSACLEVSFLGLLYCRTLQRENFTLQPLPASCRGSSCWWRTACLALRTGGQEKLWQIWGDLWLNLVLKQGFNCFEELLLKL